MGAYGADVDTAAGETAVAESVCAGDETAVVPDVASALAAELAWSAEQPELDPDDIPDLPRDTAGLPPMPAPFEPASDKVALPGSWRAVCRVALGVFAACVAIAGAVTAIDRHWFVELRTAVQAVGPPASSVAPTPDVATPVTAVPPANYPPGPAADHLVPPAPKEAEVPVETYDPDVFYLNALRRLGMTVTNPYVAIDAAHVTCSYLRMGHTSSDAAGVAMSNNATLTPYEARGYVVASTTAYCPDMAGR